MWVQVVKVCIVSEGQGIQHPILINSLSLNINNLLNINNSLNINFNLSKSPSSDSSRIIGRGIQMLLGWVAPQLGLAGLRNNTLVVDLVIHLWMLYIYISIDVIYRVYIIVILLLYLYQFMTFLQCVAPVG